MADLGTKTTGTILDEGGLEVVRRTLAERMESGEPIAHTLALNLLATVDGLRESLDQGEPSTPDGDNTARGQIDRLSAHIIKSIPGEPGQQNQGAIDTAIRLLTEWQPRDGSLAADLGAMTKERDDAAAAVEALMDEKADLRDEKTELRDELSSVGAERDAYLLELKEIGEQVGLEQYAVGNMLPATGFVLRNVMALLDTLRGKVAERPVDRDLQDAVREREIMRYELTQVWKALGQNPDDIIAALDALHEGGDTDAREGFVSETVVATIEKLLKDGQKHTSLRRELIEKLGIANLGISDDDLVEFIAGRQPTAVEEIKKLCREHGLTGERVDPGGRVLVFPSGEVRLDEMPGSETEDLATLKAFLARASQAGDEAATIRADGLEETLAEGRKHFTEIRHRLAHMLGWDSSTLLIDKALTRIEEQLASTPEAKDLADKLHWHRRTIDKYKRAIRALGHTVNELADTL